MQLCGSKAVSFLASVLQAASYGCGAGQNADLFSAHRSFGLRSVHCCKLLSATSAQRDNGLARRPLLGSALPGDRGRPAPAQRAQARSAGCICL